MDDANNDSSSGQSDTTVKSNDTIESDLGDPIESILKKCYEKTIEKQMEEMSKLIKQNYEKEMEHKVKCDDLLAQNNMLNIENSLLKKVNHDKNISIIAIAFCTISFTILHISNNIRKKMK